eukprot:Opistho-2@7595
MMACRFSQGINGGSHLPVEGKPTRQTTACKNEEVVIYLNMSAHLPIQCLNCGTRFKGNYCYQCGQKAAVQKLTWKNLIEELVHFFTHAEHSFVYTTRKLIANPAFVIKEYLDGKRVKVHKPITFLLIWAALLKGISELYGYAAKSFHLYSFEKAAPVLRLLWSGPKNTSLQGMENLISLLIQAPILVLIGWIIFRKTKYSFVESWIAIIYALAYSFIIALLMQSVVFILRLVHAPVSTGFINDFYFAGYFLCAVWVIFRFFRFYQPKAGFLKLMLIAVCLSLLANYASDLIWYLLYKSFPPDT